MDTEKPALTPKDIKDYLLKEEWKMFDTTGWDIYPQSSIEFFAKLASFNSIAFNNKGKKRETFQLSGDIIQPFIPKMIYENNDLIQTLTFWNKLVKPPLEEGNVETVINENHGLVLTELGFDSPSFGDTYLSYYRRLHRDYYDHHKELFKAIIRDRFDINQQIQQTLNCSHLDVTQTEITVKIKGNKRLNPYGIFSRLKV